MKADDVRSCNGEVGQFLCSMPFAARVNGWFFSHAANTDGRTLPQLIADLQGAVDQDGFGTKQLIGENSLLEARIGPAGPGAKSWFDVETPAKNSEQLLSRYAAALGVAHFVEGHHHGAVSFDDGAQRQAGEMFQRYGLLFLIDTGMSRDVGDSTGAILHIRTGNLQEATAICADGKRTAIWDDRRRPRIGKADVCGLSK